MGDHVVLLDLEPVEGLAISVVDIHGGPSQRMGRLYPDGSYVPEPHPRPALCVFAQRDDAEAS